MKLYGKTDPGKIRDTNQDTFAYSAPVKDGYFALVCDGMGGLNGGNIASQIARDKIVEHFIRQMYDNMQQQEILGMMQIALEKANQAVWEKACAETSLKGMGTTVVTAIAFNGKIYVAHVGDSRAYLYADGFLSRLTVDHSLVEMLVQQGKLSQEDAQNHPRRNEITRAVGAVSEIKVDFKIESFRPGNRLLLCSDGLSSACTDAKILSVMRCSNGQQLVERLVDLANEAGGKDNITAVVMEHTID